MNLHKLLGTEPGVGMQPKEIMGYSVAGLGQNLICGLIGSYIMFFYTNAIGIKTFDAAILMLAARLFDAFNDPVMGTIVDRTRTKWGKCRPYLLIMPIPIAIMTVLCFVSNDGWEYNGKLAYATCTYVVWSVAYTIVDVPYWGLATSMTNDTNKRNSMLTIARLFCTLGAGLISIIIPIFTGMIQGNHTGLDGLIIPGHEMMLMGDLKVAFLWMAILIVVIATPTFFIGFKTSKERYYDTSTVPNSLVKNLKLVAKNKPLMLIILSGVLGAAKIIFTYTGIYFAMYNIPIVMQGQKILGMEGSGLNTLITMSIVPGGLIATLLTPTLCRKFGKKNVYTYSHILGGIVLFLVYFIGWDTPTKLLINLLALVVVGIPAGFGNILSYSMIGDSVDYLEWKTGERAEGICFAMQTFINKIGMAVGAFVALIVLDIAQIDASNTESFSKNNMEGLNMIYTASILFSAISCILSAIPLFFYKFNEKEQREAVAETLARKTYTETE